MSVMSISERSKIFISVCKLDANCFLSKQYDTLVNTLFLAYQQVYIIDRSVVQPQQQYTRGYRITDFFKYELLKLINYLLQ